MTISELIKFLWDGVDIPITKEELQHSVNVLTWGIKKSITDDEDMQKINDKYKISHYDDEHNRKIKCNILI